MKTSLDDALDDVLGSEPATTTDHPTPAPPPGRQAARLTGLVSLPVEVLHPSPNNPREQLTDIEDLAASIRENGLIQPIIAREAEDAHGYVIVAGHRRHAAVQRLGWMRVDVIVRKHMRPDDDLAAMLVENGQRAGLDPIEEARALQRLKTKLACSDLDLAKKVGRSQGMVSGRLALLSLPVAQQEEVRAKQMSVVHAVAEGRIASGKVRPKGQTKGWHLDHTHALATKARARCQRLGHSRGRTVGGMACGACWESVIRADEREAIQQHAARTGTCPTCSGPYSTAMGH